MPDYLFTLSTVVTADTPEEAVDIYRADYASDTDAVVARSELEPLADDGGYPEEV